MAKKTMAKKTNSKKLASSDPTCYSANEYIITSYFDTKKNDNKAIATYILKAIKADRANGGCVTKGTLVKQANGEPLAIEKIKTLLDVNGKLNETPDQLINVNGDIVYPIKRFEAELKPFPITIKLQVVYKPTEEPYCVEVTKWHPVMRNHYSVTLAGLLSIGETVLTDQGIGVVADIQNCVYKQAPYVYSLSLSSLAFGSRVLRPFSFVESPTPDLIESLQSHSLMGLQPKEQIIYTNGIATGAFVLQTQLTEYFKDGVNVNQLV
jgi:hypothetical protein